MAITVKLLRALEKMKEFLWFKMAIVIVGVATVIMTILAYAKRLKVEEDQDQQQ